MIKIYYLNNKFKRKLKFYNFIKLIRFFNLILVKIADLTMV